MKKIFTLFAVAVLFATGLNAQYYYLPFPAPGQNPGGLNTDDEYPVGGGQPLGWTSIQAGSAATPVWSTAGTVPFTFNFNGAAVTGYKVSTSGVLTFTTAAVTVPPVANVALPSASIPDNSICVWGITGSGTNDNICYKTFGTAPNQQHWIIFSSYTDPGNAAYTYFAIVLEETTNNIYVVDQRNGGTALTLTIGIQVDASTAYSVSGSPSIAQLAGSSETPADNVYYQFVYGTQAAFDLSTNDITTASYLVVGNNDIKGEITNYGSTTITSLTLNYKINGGTAVTDAVTGISIAPLGVYSFTHSIPWNTTAAGAYTVECYATDLNGSNVDANPANDSKTETINILTVIEPRIPLFEIFTSSTCPPCQPGNANFHSIVDPLPAADHVYIKYQQDFPGTGDPYCTQEALDRRAFYNINSIPRMENDGGWDGNANSFTIGLYNAAKAIPAQYIMNATYTNDVPTKTLSAKIVYSPLFAATGTQLYTAIIEKTTSLNVKTNGETDFFNVMKKMVPDAYGLSINNIAAGTFDSVTVTYTFQGNYRLPADGQPGNVIDNSFEHSVEQFSDLVMIGWLQSGNGDNQVYQASNYTPSIGSGIYEMNKSVNSILIFPSPANEFTSVEISLNSDENIKIQLMDNSGKSIETRQISGKSGLTKETFNTSTLANGVYHVAVYDSKNNAFVKRIVVEHAK